jgi:KaiC/GvpD/RAD55 family RecA-like ATPase
LKKNTCPIYLTVYRTNVYYHSKNKRKDIKARSTMKSRGEQKLKTIKTGIAGLDEFLQGGLPPVILLLTGDPGSGNEVFARQTAFNIANTTTVTYFTVSTPPKYIKEDMAAYGWNTAPLEEKGQWKFTQLSDKEDIFNIITQEIKKNRVTIVDSLSELLSNNETEKITKLLIEMSHYNKSNQCHLVLLTEGMQDKKIETALEHYAEGVIVFNTNWGSENINRNIVVKKFRGSSIPARRLQYTIDKKGFLIETATRITSRQT